MASRSTASRKAAGIVRSVTRRVGQGKASRGDVFSVRGGCARDRGMSPRRVERIGLIGLGKHGRRYARHITEDLPDLTLAAIARRDAAQLDALRAVGAAAFSDYRAMIAEARLDAVIAVVPP